MWRYRGLVILILGCFVLPISSVQAIYFEDVPPSAFGLYPAVEYLAYKKVIATTKKNFDPISNISRAEALKMILKYFFSEATATPLTTFKDVPTTAWYAPYVAKAVELGVSKGSGDGLFHPEATVTYAEFLKMIVIAGKVNMSAYTASGEWYQKYLQIAKDLSLAPNGRDLGAGTKLTRGEAAQVLFLFIANYQESVQQILDQAETYLVQTLDHIKTGHIAEAKSSIEMSLAYIAKAKQKAPTSTIIQQASNLAQAFKLLIAAYEDGAAGRAVEAQNKVSEANKLLDQITVSTMQAFAGELRNLGKSITNPLP